MADGNPNMHDPMTDSQRQSLAIHCNTMDIETAGYLHKIHGIAELMMRAIEGGDSHSKLPGGLQEGAWVITDLAHAALKRAGAV